MRIAIVEDDSMESSRLKSYITKYAEKSGKPIEIDIFEDGLTFLSDYNAGYDIVFMDIKMPNMNGLDIAKHLRKVDKDVCLIFVTSMSQYAIKGYEVNALDYILKPVEYQNFVDKLIRAERYLETKKSFSILIKFNDTMVKLNTDTILYVAKDKNYLIFRTTQEPYRVRGTLLDVEKQLLQCGFGKCNHGCLVNYKYVNSLNKNTVEVGGESLPLSRRDRQEFVDKLVVFCEGRTTNV